MGFKRIALDAQWGGSNQESKVRVGGRVLQQASSTRSPRCRALRGGGGVFAEIRKTKKNGQKAKVLL